MRPFLCNSCCSIAVGLANSNVTPRFLTTMYTTVGVLHYRKLLYSRHQRFYLQFILFIPQFTFRVSFNEPEICTEGRFGIKPSAQHLSTVCVAIGWRLTVFSSVANHVFSRNTV